MNTFYRNIVACIIITTTVACGNKQNAGNGHSAKDELEQKQNNTAVCEYKIIQDSTHFSWTAYKTTDKVGVSGTFDKLSINAPTTAETVLGVFEEAKFKLATSSVNSGNPDRDGKISEHFFGAMMAGLQIDGHVKEMHDDHALVIINMNSVSVTQKMHLDTDHETYCKLSADLDLNHWNVLASIKALNDVCFDLHKGADGESKLWEEVRVEITAKVKKDCS